MSGQFLSSFNLVQMFTEPRWQQKYMSGAATEQDSIEFPGCMKPIEFFCADIYSNLVEWTVIGGEIYYRTKRYWYIFSLRDSLVEMTRYDRRSYQRWDSWANLHSVKDMGREWLMKEPQLSKYVKPAEGMERESRTPGF